jgi:hypothetical protein
MFSFGIFAAFAREIAIERPGAVSVPPAFFDSRVMSLA